MTTAFDAPLNEAFRDAMLALYLHEAVPNDPYLIKQGLTQHIKTANDLYEFWLLDVLVSQDVPTSPVACAIASYQQQINSMMLNMEPGYSDDSFTPQQIKTWRDGLNRFPIWSAIQQLHYFPDIYLDRKLRLTKTDSFEQLENDLNQAQIQPETVQTAVLSYLARFEEIANLKICNGYIDGEDFANSTYYFIGKSPAENAYYWRSLDMRQRPVKEPAAGPGIVPYKFDKPLPNAWSDWQRANVPISEKALEHTIRPCWFNNRLFVIWAELELQDADATQLPVEGRADDSVKVNPRFRLYASYKKYDDSWSTPRIYIENYCQTKALIEKPLEQIAEETQTIAVYDHSTSPESMVIMLYSNYEARTSEIPGNSDKYDFLRTVRIDKNFNVTPLFPSHGVVPNDKPGTPPSATAFQDDSGHVLLIGHIFANRNAGRFQYWLPASTPVFGALEHETPKTEENTWNFNNWQSRIKTWEERSELVYHPGSSGIELILRLDEGFADVTTIKFSVSTATGVELFNLTLVFSHTDKSEWLTLLEGSEIKSFTGFMDNPDTVYCFRGFPDSIRSLISDPDSNNRTEFSVPRLAPSETASLKGKLAGSHILDLLRDHPDQIAIFDFWRFPRGGESSSMIVFPGIKHHVVESYGYQLFIGHPLDVMATEFPATLEDIRPLYRSGIVEKLPEYSGGGGITVPVDKISYQPVGWPVEWPDNPAEMKIPLVYGVLIHNKNRFGYSLVGGALKAISITWGEALATEQQIAARINDHDSPSLGNAQYIDFAGSSIEFSDGCKPDGDSRAPIRMNTTFARELIQLAESGMDPLLSWETQTQQTEPPIPNGLGAQAMDFSGAYYLYFLELFLYLPWLVADVLNEQQQYEEAKHWLAYLFAPSRQSADPGHPGYWQAVPLETPVWPGAPDPSQAIVYPDDPHQIALSFPVHFRKALYGLYLDIESNQADQAYRELTPDGLAEAKLRYVHILALLGPPPHARQVDVWSPITLDKLSAASNKDLRAFEQQLIATQRQLQDKPPLRIGKAPQSQDAPLLCLRPYREDSSLATVDNPYLRRPFNPELIKRWDRAESRLYNLRHNLDMAGNPLNLPLFAAPLDPRALLAAWGQGLSGAALSRLLSPQIPHYRFSFMFALAQNAVDSVIQFGSTLLSLIERKEQAQYLELQQQQAWNLAKMAVDIQTQAMEIDEKNREALQASQAVVASRISHYAKLINDGVSPLEIAAGAVHYLSGAAQVGASLIQIPGEMAKIVPNIFGLAAGGQRYEGTFFAATGLLQATATGLSTDGQLMDRIEQYRRRAQEWTLAHNQATLEAEQIKAQLAVQEAQHHATQLQLRQAQTALNQAKATHDFLLSSNRFSRSQTYDWLNSKFAGFYHTAYTTAQSLCQAAEACWQYEMGDFTRTFIRPGGWNASYRGLGAGEELKMSLQQMHSQYLQNNRRDLEIRKTVSLKDLKDQDPGPSLNKTWAEIKKSLVNNGTCEFELTQAMFDDDYAAENHYLRRIKTISVTLPACLGPYQDIRAILRQTYSKVEMAATAGNVKENLRASQQIALSTSLEDNGMFQLNFQDDRYLPFEYTGAVSRWNLIFPNHEKQRAMLQSLPNIIVHVSYTARREGGSQ
ncbi:efflux RND transporter periplasmic adaptor subunit [Pseudomonas sp. P155]|uniref:Efflux RND transporter periplasmic adaptor subunit n=1 Tax=Pseudomonas neuropathica TaxID=2730425 RepID=A0ABS0BMR2_9PSED|nr:neuraminidase-like domain-containing protein [Pseudomonas neuropathica]MBF6035741.1 efflux RND transporter periplasmic adaptor subunit [Pseudomonas neuropathica]